MTAVATAPWWVRPGLEVPDGRLAIAGEDAEALARRHGTPLFVYDLVRFAENARAMQAGFARTGLPFRLRLALKANPLPEVLSVFRGLGAPGTPESIGIDACSPGEVLRALECGWRPDEISFTGSNVSERDLDVLLAHPIHLNLDTISQIERYGRRAPGSRVGIRIDPAAGAGYNAHLEYSGERPTKFGIGLERFDEALAAAAVARHLGPLGVTIAAEPGDYLTKDAAILLGEVVTVEARRGVTFVGLDIGWNVNCAYFIYGFAQELVLCRDAEAPRSEIVTVAGHINEASDVFAEDYPLPPVLEGDIVALLNAGGYHQAMSSTHCLRPTGTAIFLDR